MFLIVDSPCQPIALFTYHIDHSLHRVHIYFFDTHITYTSLTYTSFLFFQNCLRNCPISSFHLPALPPVHYAYFHRLFVADVLVVYLVNAQLQPPPTLWSPTCWSPCSKFSIVCRADGRFVCNRTPES